MKITKRQLKRIIKEVIGHPSEAERAHWEKRVERAVMDDLDTVAELYLNEFGDDADGFMDDDRDTLNKKGLSWDDTDVVYDLILDKLSAKLHSSVAASPNKKELKAIGGSYGPVEDREVEYLTYQPIRRGGKVVAFQVEDSETPWGTMPLGHSTFVVDEQWASQSGTSVDKIISVLEKGGATLRKRRKAVKWDLPYYD